MNLTKKIRFLLTAIIISCVFLSHFQPALATERKKPNWLASCPEVVDVNPSLPTPETVFLRSPSGQEFKLLAKDSVDFVTEPQPIIGCYVYEENVINRNLSPAWQIGALNRDLNGYYFKNQAGVTWRLTLNSQTLVLETEPGSLYYKQGGGFRLDVDHIRATDCKVKDYFLSAGRLGFPRNTDRVPQFGLTKNLILVVDFPDAILSENIDSVVENVLAPSVVENFFLHSSNGRFKPTFITFPRVIRLNSLEKSFAPNSTGGFLINGEMQDHRLVFEAIKIARTQGSLDGYSSINVFAPTAKLLGYYGSAFLNLPLDVGDKQIYNSQLIGGTIGTVNSTVPSWKVFAHEYGHQLGMYDYYLQGTENSGKSPGPFDLMGNTTGSANSFLGFQRWVQGWFEDSDVVCDFEPNSSVLHTLSPLNDLSGTRLYVHPLDGTTVLSVEFRTEGDIDRLNGNEGLLVYITDMKAPGLSGPIRIQASEQDLVINPPTDRERYSTAPLSTGQFVRVKDLVVFAETIGSGKASFRVFTNSEFAIKQSADAKAAADKAAADKAAAENAASEARIIAAKSKYSGLSLQIESLLKKYPSKKSEIELYKKKIALFERIDQANISTVELNLAGIESKLVAMRSIYSKIAKTITCTKGKKSLKVLDVNPKCPAGYKVKK